MNSWHKDMWNQVRRFFVLMGCQLICHLWRQIEIVVYKAGQVLHLMIGDIQDSVFYPQGFQLLVIERHAIWQWRDMPMHMAIALLASQ